MTVPDSPDAVPLPPDPSEQLELKLPDESAAPKDLALWAGVLVLLALVAYWPSLGGRFQWLDDRAVAHDHLLAAPGGLSAVWAGRWEDAGRYPFPVYQPVAFSADWLAYRLGGHDDQGLPTPTAYHALSLACHAGAAILAWLALRELLVPGAWLVAAVFALHPANAEAVSWISDAGVPVGGVLFWGSAYAFLMYTRFRNRDAADQAAGGTGGDPAQTWGLYAAAAALAVLAALAWPAAGAVPGVVLLGLWWRRRGTTLDTLLLAPVLAVNVALWLANLDLPRHIVPGGVPALADLDVVHMVAAIGQEFWFVILTLCLPFRLTLIYPPVAGAIVWSTLSLALAFAVAVRWGRAALAAVGAFALCVTPALNWFDPARHAQLADSAAYLAVVPLAGLVVAAVAAGLRRVRSGEGRTQAGVIASAMLLIALGAGAWGRAHVFETPVSLWQDTAMKAPSSPFAHAMLAEQLRLGAAEDAAAQDVDATKADLQAATAEAARAADLATAANDATDAAAAQRTWAAALVAGGDAHGALPHFALATQAGVGASDAATLVDYGQALVTLGKPAGAVAQLDRALAADPTSATAHRVLGQAYAKLGNEARNLREEQLAVDADPSDLVAQQLLAEALARAGRLPEALQHYTVLAVDKATQTRPDLWAAIARIKDQQGAYDEAVAFLTQARTLDPTLPNIDRDLATEQAKLKRAAVTRPAMTQPTTQP